MQNKFLKKYPDLYTPRIGDRVKVTQLLHVHSKDNKPMKFFKYTPYSEGDIGIIISSEIRDYPGELYRINFNKQGNRQVHIDGVWSLWKEEFELFDEE
jgi:hypothetical protein